MGARCQGPSHRQHIVCRSLAEINLGLLDVFMPYALLSKSSYVCNVSSLGDSEAIPGGIAESHPDITVKCILGWSL